MFKKNKPQFPDDADGNTLQRIAEDVDLTRPRIVDFHIAAKSEDSAISIAQACEKLRYHAGVSKDEDDDSSWTVTCTTRMVLNYDSASAFQDELHDLAKPLGGYSDGWGTRVDTGGMSCD
jgi:regulator of RNase E activity RraB